MKVICPCCNKVLYTNPFASNETLDCPYCDHHLVRAKETNDLLKISLVVDIVTYAVLASILRLFFQETRVLVGVVFCFLSEYMFELPQRSLQTIGKLIYEVKEDD